uniref:CNOT1_HEAT domain-containing protein n=1 Tax=Panagrellus redivivus TaxID=6233 RepID=A0A7E4W0G9_PANRE
MAGNVRVHLHAALLKHGTSFTESVDKCKSVLLDVARNLENPVLDSKFAAEVLATIVSHDLPDIASTERLEDLWISTSYECLPHQLNAPIVTKVLRILTAEEFSWDKIFDAFQECNLMVRNKSGLQFITSAILEDGPPENFPIQRLLRPWQKNRLGQLAWVGLLIYYEDLFCFSDFPHRELDTSVLKSQPDTYNRGVANWTNLDLLELILTFNESYPVVVCEIITRRKEQKVFVPALQVPDLLLLGIHQLKLPMTEHLAGLVKQLIVNLMVHTLNAVCVLNELWVSDTVTEGKSYRSVIVDGMASFYSMGGDDHQNNRLTKVLEVAHELKPNGLGEMFTGKQFQFTIDLACLAARRDFLKLDKFLDDKLSEHAEIFAQHVVNYIKRRYLTPALSHETFQIMYNALNLRAQYATAINVELASLNVFIRAMNTRPEGPSPRPSSLNPYGNVGSPGSPFFIPGRGGIGSDPMSLNANGSMTTPVFGTVPSNGRPMGASTPTSYSPYQSPMGQGPMGDMRGGPMGGDMYRAPIPGAPPPGWGSSGWSSRSTPIPGGQMDFRPAFAQAPGAGPSQQQQIPNGSNPNNQIDLAHVTFSDEIQDEANSYFQQMFTDTNPLSVSDFIKQMVTFRNSTSSKDRDVLHCVIKNLFDEFKFFNEYPEYELKTTAEVFGGFINEGVVEYLHFAAAVRRVIDALQAEVSTPLFTFGIVALQACKEVLHRYPKVCMMICGNPSFSKFPVELRNYVNAGCSSELPSIAEGNLRLPTDPSKNSFIAEAAQNAVLRSAEPSSSGSQLMTVSNMDILEKGTEREGKTVVLAQDSLIEEVSFLCNNLSLANLPNKVEDIRKIINDNDDNFREWLAQYLVMKRITLEQNFHALYNGFLLALNDVTLNDMVKLETLRNIKILLKSDKKHAASNFCDRQLLKNLGHWLGLITLGRNEPILLDELNLRDLLLEAFYKGQQELLYVIPFVVKVIISCGKSSVFNPTCAWIHQILQILAEIHRQSDLKLNLKFEIEVLCKELQVNLDNLICDNSLLQDTDRITLMTQQLSEVTMLTQPTDGQSGDMLGGLYVPAGRGSAVQGGMYPPPGNSADAELVQNSMAAAYPSMPVGGPVHGNAPAQFLYTEVNVHESIEQQITIPHLPLFQTHLHLIAPCRNAIGTAVMENINGIVERSISCALALTIDIIQKDFAYCTEPSQVRRAVLQMMRSMTSAIGMITTRETLATNIVGYLRQVFQNLGQLNLPPHTDVNRIVEEAIIMLVEANIDLTGCFIVKTACEKGTLEADKRMEEFIRMLQTGQPVVNEVTPEVQDIIDKMPEELRPRNRAFTDAELSVYDIFSGLNCGFKPSTIEDMFLDYVQPRNCPSMMIVSNPEPLVLGLKNYMKTVVEPLIASASASNGTKFPSIVGLEQILAAVEVFVQDASADHMCVFIDALIDSLYTNLKYGEADRTRATSLIDVFLNVCHRLLQHIPKADFTRVVTRVIVSHLKSSSYNAEALEIVLRQRIVNATVIDQYFSNEIRELSEPVVAFVQQLFRLMSENINNGRSQFQFALPVTFKDFRAFMLKSEQPQRPVLAAPSNNRVVGNGTHPAGGFSNGDTRAAAPEEVLPYANDFHTKAETILRDWMNVCNAQEYATNRQDIFSPILLSLLQDHNITTEENVLKLLKTCLAIVLDVAYRLLREQTPNMHRNRYYYTVDTFSRFVCVLIKNAEHIGGTDKTTLLQKALDVITQALVHDHENREADFNGLPFHRIFLVMFMDLCNTEASEKWTILESFGHALFFTQPRSAPGFVFQWLDIIGHRAFISQLLADPQAPPLTRAIYTQLLLAHLKFMAPTLRNVSMTRALQDVYKGTLRIMLVVLHDFPELLCEYYYVLCDVIPPNCVQLRNLVLSAYPRNMRLPDPFGQSFAQIEQLPEMEQMPHIPFEMFKLIPEELRNKLDDYLRARQGVTFFNDLANVIESGQTPGSKYNVPVMNAIVSFVGARAIQHLQENQQRISMSSIIHSSYMDVFQNFAVTLCTEGRYILFNALANHLRYPNAQTHYFACTLLYLFGDSSGDLIKEQITRILFERLVSLRPHPWGLLITFIELIKNEQYNFWSYKFVHCAPEIERLFISVASSCNVTVPPSFLNQCAEAVSGGASAP